MIADKHPSGARRATRRLLLALLVSVSAAMVLHWASLTFLWSGADTRSRRHGGKPAAARRQVGHSREQEACVAAAVDSSAGVHSRIEKGGPLDIRLWHANHTEWRNERFRRWAVRGVVNPRSAPHSRVGLEGRGGGGGGCCSSSSSSSSRAAHQRLREGEGAA